jgi:hypothetical protein
MPRQWMLSGAICLGLSACAAEQSVRSERFWDFFGDTTAVFRGVSPGGDFAAVYGRETAVPRYDDELGLQYRMRPAPGVELFVEYRKDAAGRIQAINAEMIFADETEARDFFDECRNHLTQKYRRPEKNGDRWIWKIPNGRITLRLIAPKKTLVLSATAE